jgi:hypothetical protein
MWGAMKNQLTNESYHTTWRMKLFMNGNGILLKNKILDEIDNMEC